MSFTKGSITYCRFRAPAPDRQQVEDGLADNAWQEPQSPVWRAPVIGWCCHDSMLDADFSDVNRWVFGQYLLFSLRVAEKKVPTTLLQAHLQRRISTWCAEHGRSKAPASVRAELKDALLEEMLRQALPSNRIVQVVWDTREGLIRADTVSESMLDLLRKHLRRSFGVTAEPYTPLGGLDETIRAQFQLLGPADLRAGGDR